MEQTAYFTAVVYILAGIVGLCVGSFLNVVIYRVPLGMSVAYPPSHCPGCGKPIKWYDNIPVLSYIILGGKCRNCRMHISFRYTAVEVLNAAAWLVCVWRFLDESIVMTAVSAVTISVLICVFFIDLEKMIIPDRFQIILAVLGVLAAVFDKSPISSGKYGLHHIIGAVAGFGVFALVSFVGEKTLGREALGGGDVKLAGCMGLFLGWQKLILAVLDASLIGSIVLVVIVKISKKSDAEYPFAPFLSFGFALSILAGDAVISAYLALLT